MGVSIIAIIEPALAYTDEEYAALPDDESRDAVTDALHRVRNIPVFSERADGRPEGWYTAKDVVRGPSSPYSGYGYFREQIAMRVLGVEPQTVWNDEETYEGKPFYEIIEFADNEGAIGPVTCAKLAKDFREHREKFLDEDTWLTFYDDMTACLEAASEGAGFVLYR